MTFRTTTIRLNGAPFGRIVQADSLDYLRTLESNSIDDITLDAPYGLSSYPLAQLRAMLLSWLEKGYYEGKKKKGFMGKGWDGLVPQPILFQEAFRVLKPGGFLKCFAGTRTQHLMATSIALAGFEIKDLLAWLYSSGFPKGKNMTNQMDKEFGGCGAYGRAIPTASTERPDGSPLTANKVDKYEARTELGKQYEGFDIALKPALEPITLAQKPREGTYAQNLRKWGTGALNVGACKIVTGKPADLDRWPANLLHDGSPDDEAIFPNQKSGAVKKGSRSKGNGGGSVFGTMKGYEQTPRQANEGSAARLFYCSKASKKERNAGLDSLPEKRRTDGRKVESERPYIRTSPVKNHHPTVKPIDVMRWLMRLTCPPGGHVLDMFFGSGTSGCAALLEGFNYTGVDIDDSEGYHAISTLRNLYWAEVAKSGLVVSVDNVRKQLEFDSST